MAFQGDRRQFLMAAGAFSLLPASLPSAVLCTSDAHAAIDACRAGKDVWIETTACTSIEDCRELLDAARRYGRIVQAATVWRSSPEVQELRARVANLADVHFCRTFTPSSLEAIDLVQFVFGDPLPHSVSAQGSMAAHRYANFVASYESGNGSTTFHGARSTLTLPTVDLAGARLRHWQNFLDCVRTRQTPIGDIETCFRSAMTLHLSSLARKQNRTEISYEHWRLDHHEVVS